MNRMGSKRKPKVKVMVPFVGDIQETGYDSVYANSHDGEQIFALVC
jgi:hypothetical protein